MNKNETLKIRKLPFECWTSPMLLEEFRFVAAHIGVLAIHVDERDTDRAAQTRKENLRIKTERLNEIKKQLNRRLSP